MIDEPFFAGRQRGVAGQAVRAAEFLVELDDHRGRVDLENPAVSAHKTAHKHRGVELVKIPLLEGQHVVGADFKLAANILERLALLLAGGPQLISNGWHPARFLAGKASMHNPECAVFAHAWPSGWR